MEQEAENVIVKLLANLKLDGDFHAIGTFLEVNVKAVAQQLEAKCMQIIEGATSVEHAAEIDAAATATAVAAEAEAAANAPKDTFGPFPENAEAPAKPEGEAIAPVTATGEEATATGTEAPTLTKYTVLNADGVKLADGTVAAKDAVVEMNAEDKATVYFLENNLIAPVVEEQAGDNL